MKFLSDKAIERLRAGAEEPDLAGTRYRLLERVARGGMGVVYAAEDEKLERRVALKVLDVPGTDGDLANRLMREARVIARLEHPGIVPVHDVGTLPDGRVFYTMKLVQGQRLDQHAAELGGVPERLRTFQKICEAVAFAHAHDVVHRDLKPQNIMVGRFGEVLVMDWGLAKLLNATTTATDAENIGTEKARDEQALGTDTGHGVILGTPGYMAPEQARGEVAAIGPRADVYSLGAVLKFLLVGAGSGSRPTSRALAAIAGKATAEDAEQRYGSVEELASDVAHYLDGLPVCAYPEGPIRRAWRWVIKNRAWILLIVAYLVMRAVFILWRGR